jgi:hypothetical protein
VANSSIRNPGEMRYPVLNEKPAINEARHRVSAVGFKHYVTEMVRWATSGLYTPASRGANRTNNLKIAERRVGPLSAKIQRHHGEFNVPDKGNQVAHPSAESQRDIAALNCRQTLRGNTVSSERSTQERLRGLALSSAGDIEHAPPNAHPLSLSS